MQEKYGQISPFRSKKCLSGKLAMAALCAGMLSAVISLKYIGNNWNIVLREADAGINRLSYFLAVSGI